MSAACSFTSLRLLLAWAIRRLPKYISPSGRRADVDIAEPQRVVEGMSVVAAFFPKPCGHCSGIAPNAHSLHGVFLMLIDRSPTTRVVEEVCLGVGLAGSCHEHKIISQDAIHRGSIVLSHVSLVLGTECCNRFSIVVSRRNLPAHKSHHRKHNNRNGNSNKSIHLFSLLLCGP